MTLLRSEDEEMLADAARKFLDDHAPVGHLRALRDAGKTHDPVLWSKMAEMGWAGVLVPEEHGGSDMGHAAANILAEEMGKTLAVSPFLSTAVIAAAALRRSANKKAQAALTGIAGGELTYALAVDEGHKHDPDATEMVAEPDGNGFRLTGRKRCVMDGGFADRVLVVARAAEGLTLFDLPLDRNGIDRTPRPLIDCRDAVDLTFDSVLATGDDVLGGSDVLRPALQAGQAALAAEMAGLANGAFQMTVGYLKDRKQFGQPIGAFQALQHRAAHLWSETEITASTILNAGRVLDSGEDPALAVSLAKARATATAQLAVREGVQMHGGIGMTDAFDMGFFMKHARVAAEWLGDYSYHAEIIARLRGF